MEIPYKLKSIEHYKRDRSGMGGMSPSETTITIFVDPKYDIDDKDEGIIQDVINNVSYFPADYVYVEIEQFK